MLRASVACAALALACIAQAQVAPRPPPPTPDARAYPQLAALKQWLEGGSPQARQCVLSGGLYLDADRHYRETRSEAQTIEAVMRANADKLNAPERERLRSLVTGTASMAAALHELDAESAAVAFSVMCASRAQRPGVVPAPNTIRAQFEAAYQCQRRHSPGSLERKECVAQAFSGP